MVRYTILLSFLVLACVSGVYGGEKARKSSDDGSLSGFRIVETINLNNGEKLVYGHFENQVRLGDTTLVSHGRRDFLILKFDAARQFQWFVHGGGKAVDELVDVVPTAHGGFLIAGQFSATIAIGEWVLKSHGRQDVFIGHLSDYGTIDWLRNGGGAADDLVHVIKAAPGQQYGATVFFSKTAFFCDRTLTAAGKNGAWLLRLDNAGWIVNSKWLEGETRVTGY